MQTGSQILSVQPDERLGLGANSAIPAIDPKANLDTINQVARDILLMNHANNIKLFDQKIKDRDNTLELLASGQIAAGKIDPNDRKVYDTAKKEVSDNFYEMIKNGGLNNPEAVRKYYDSVGNLKNVATWAQSRQIEFDKLNAEKSQQTLDEDIKRYDTHIQDMKKQDFWNPIVPMQKAFNYDIEQTTKRYQGIPTVGEGVAMNESGTATTQWNTITDKNGVITNKTTTKTAPLRSAQLTRQVPKTGGVTVNKDGSLSEISYTPEKYWDYDTIQTNVQEAYISDPKERQTQIEWFNDVNAYDDAQKLRLLKAYNNRIAQYNTEREIQPVGTNPDGTPRYENQVNYAVDPATGKVLIQETPTSFMAKHALASIEGNYVEKPQAVFNKDIAGYKIDQEKLRLGQAELAQKAANDRAELSLKWANYGLEKKKLDNVDTEDLSGANTVLNEALSIIKNGTPRDVVEPGGKNRRSVLRISDPTLLQTFGNIDKDGNITNVPDAINYDPKTNQPTLLYFDPEDPTGKRYIKEVPLDQRTWLKHITRRSFPNKDIGKINSLIEDVLEKNGNSLFELSKKETKVQPTELDPNGFKKEGKYWRYKDGTLYNDKGEIVK